MRKIITYGVPVVVNMAACAIITYLPEGRFLKWILSIAIPLVCYCFGLWVSLRLTEDIKNKTQ